MGFSGFFIDAIKVMYANAWITIIFRSCNDIGYWLAHSIKQRGPLSRSIFTLAVDPILRMLACGIPLHFADFGTLAGDAGAGQRPVLEVQYVLPD